LVLELLVSLPGQVASDEGLEPGDDLVDFVVAKFFKETQGTGAEEDLFFVFHFYTPHPETLKKISIRFSLLKKMTLYSANGLQSA
jgi:hypothetical protein